MPKISQYPDGGAKQDTDRFVIARGGVNYSLLGSAIGAAGGGDAYNYLINGGLDFAQRQTPGTLTTITDNGYSADRWRVTRENADVQYQRNDATGETGLTSRYYGRFTKITNAGKMHVCQIVEGINSVPLRGKTVTFQAKLKSNTARTYRMAILELQNAGVIDTIPGTLVTAFGADTVDPTLGANVAVITGAQSKSVTTSWAQYSVSVTVPSNSKNVLVAIWSDSDVAANGTLDIAEAGLYVSASEQDWKPRLTVEELVMCQRYYTKSYDVDTVPGTATQTGMAATYNDATTQTVGYVPFKVNMRTTPTVVAYSPITGTASRIRSSGADVTYTSISFGASGIAAVVATLTANVTSIWQYTAVAEL